MNRLKHELNKLIFESLGFAPDALVGKGLNDEEFKSDESIIVESDKGTEEFPIYAGSCQDIDFAISYISKYELGVLICSQNLELALLSNFAEEDPGVLLQNIEGKWYPADVAIHLNLAAICYKMADIGLPLNKPSNSKVANKYLKFVQEVVD
jgi:hypothetical protein